LEGFLYIDPLKQGLKLSYASPISPSLYVFIHRSIKTRIETEGLEYQEFSPIEVFIHRSIKTRIETNRKIGLEPD